MSDFYSNLYQSPANGPSTTKTYKGPMGHRSGETYNVLCTFTNSASAPFGASSGDQLHLCEVAEGTKLIAFSAVPSADLDTNNDFTFNLGFTGATTDFASANTGLQSASAYTIANSAAITVAASRSGDKSELLLTRAAGSLEAAGTITFLCTFLVP